MAHCCYCKGCFVDTTLLDTVITSFLSKHKNPPETQKQKDADVSWRYRESDIWTAIERELRDSTKAGQTACSSAVDLAWTIVDRSLKVLDHSNDPQLQFFEFFESEIREIVCHATYQDITEYLMSDLTNEFAER